jgi:hypothetical protein
MMKQAIWIVIMLFVFAGAVGNHTHAGDVRKNQEQMQSQKAGLSGDQLEFVKKFGPPEAFKIIIHQEQTDSSTTFSRYEIWDYFSFKTSIAFVDGEFAGDEEIKDIPDLMILPVMYRPEQFITAMSLDEVKKRIIGSQVYEKFKLPDDYLEDSLLIGLEQLVLGFERGKLTYAETIPLMSNEGKDQ